MSGAAWFSDCLTYRYALLRQIDLGLLGGEGRQGRCLNFVMLNPSTADETTDDPTIRRCIGFARAWGYGELMVTNLFAYRSTDPRALYGAPDPVGPENDEYIRKIAEAADLIVAAWGAHTSALWRASQVQRLLGGIREVWCLGKTKDGYPRHLLYVPKAAERVLLGGAS